MPSITDSRVLIMATDGFELSELTGPLEQLRSRGAEVKVCAPHAGSIRGWQGKDWAASVDVDFVLDKVDVDDYDALVLPGGQINPDLLRIDAKALAIIRDFLSKGKVVAAICHAPWLLIETGAVAGREVTSYISIKTDMKNAGGRWVDRPVAVDQGIITSRNPKDIDAFVAKIVEEIEEGTHRRAA